jgi:inosose dehydratase
VLHPHVDTLVETAADVELALEHTDVLWCLDTGTCRSVGSTRWCSPGTRPPGRPRAPQGRRQRGGRPGALARAEPARRRPVRAVQALGAGDVAIDDVVVALEEKGYTGLYVLEQTRR